MSDTVSMLKPVASNPATNPTLTDTLEATVHAKKGEVLDVLHQAAKEFGAEDITFANSFGAEDMVLTDIILNNDLGIGIFSLDTGRLPTETYDLMAEVEKHYNTKLDIFFPQAQTVEFYVKNHGINAFYESVELRKSCCHMRKVEPLQRALKGKHAWITGMRTAQATTRASLPVREFDDANKLEKFNPLSDWTEQEIWAYIRMFNVPYNALHDQFYPSIGCAPCTRAVAVGEDVRAGRWWWEDPNNKECGLHVKK
ncbi:MAG TPA: phosphoadenylyl-sulfate reductase [Methylotenera sp.]|nr:phosphoadenylyl-sulfate reductase [Methylotenera sp.]HPV44424.1 phosphoadenylyl-sulfate reductase [Methylotenera sp.]